MRLSMYKVFKPEWKFLTVVLLAAGLTGCGGGDEIEGPPPGGGNNPPSTVRVSYPVSNSIEDLGNGVYRRVGSVIVTDSEGNAVADGTQVNLILIDSIKATGTIGDAASGESINGTKITDLDPLLGDFLTATTLDTAYVERGGTKFIDDTDHVFMFNVFAADSARQVAAKTAANPTNTTLDVTAPYSVVYPNAAGVGPYDGVSFITQYVVGSSLLGASVEGAGGTVGYTTTSGGVGTFYITYPANVNHILSGCLGTLDTRHLPAGSAVTLLYAEVAKFETINIIDNSFCFAAIKGGEFTAVQTGGNVTGTCVDGGDGVPLPFIDVSVGSSDSSITVTTPAVTTDINGDFSAAISGAGGSATITVDCDGISTGTVDVTL